MTKVDGAEEIDEIGNMKARWIFSEFGQEWFRCYWQKVEQKENKKGDVDNSDGSSKTAM
jgi:hypothetical protein